MYGMHKDTVFQSSLPLCYLNLDDTTCSYYDGLDVGS